MSEQTAPWAGRTAELLFVIHSATFGGPHNQALRLSAPLRAQGVRTTVVLPLEPGTAPVRLRQGGVEVVQIRLHRVRATADPRVQLPFAAGFIPEVLALRRLIVDRRADIVQVGGLVNPHAAIAARLAGVPVVWQLVDTRAQLPVAFVSMLFVRALADVVMPTGRNVMRSFPGAKYVRSRLMPFIPPVDTELFRPQPELREQVRREWGLPPDVPVVGTVANLNPQKGLTELVDAFALTRRALPDVRLVIVGAEYEVHRAYADAIRARLAVHGLRSPGEVTFVGPRSDVERQMQGFDLFALPSVPRSEGIPTVVLEAMACGLPVVATDVGGVSEVIVPDVTGTVVPVCRPDLLAAAAVSILQDDARSIRMGQAARQHAQVNFSIERCVETHLRAYRAACQP
ncbi:MAG: glycosyltransferase [Chloroflexi bacterium]|nr:glycosyltransferase [Chloroflexota bacterium]